MKRSDPSLAFGALLVVAGVLFLMQSAFDFNFAFEATWSILFALGGLAFLVPFVRDPRFNWWAVIPSFTLLALGMIIAADTFLPFVREDFLGSLFLGSIGLSFLVIYLVRREFWWAVIPGGVMFTLAFVAGVGESGLHREAGSVFFLGLAATFALVAVMPTTHGRMTWAFIPAITLFALAIVSSSVFAHFWPIALILAGGYLVYKTIANSTVSARMDNTERKQNEGQALS